MPQRLLERYARSCWSAYQRMLAHPQGVLATVVIILLAAGVFGRNVYFDASAKTLVARNDAAYQLYERVNETFGQKSFVLITFEPDSGQLFSRESLALLSNLQHDIDTLTGVSSTSSILDVPLLEATSRPLTEIARDPPTLRKGAVDLQAAAEELMNNPLIAGSLLAEDGMATLIRAELDYGVSDSLAPRVVRARLIESLRSVRDQHESQGSIELGGVPLIAADMIRFVKRDVVVFSGVVVSLLAVVLALFFRQPRWVVLPVVCGIASVVLTVGWLGVLGRPVTVISANFAPVVFILSLSLAVHLTVRYRELAREHSSWSQRKLVTATMRTKLAPCFYTALTTCVAFASLLTSDIQPIFDFGWTVCVGVIAGFLASYTLFPVVLCALNKQAVNEDAGLSVVRVLRDAAASRAAWILSACAVVGALTLGGLSLVSLESRFVDYFRADTDIHRGLAYIDDHFGGTLPFDVVVDFAPAQASVAEDDPFFVPGMESGPGEYWYTPAKLERLTRLDKFIASRPHVGATTSLADLYAIARQLNDGKPLDAVQLNLLQKEIPAELRSAFLAPYANPEKGSLRIAGRMRQSGGLSSHDAFQRAVVNYATHELGFLEDDVRITGMMVLFDNMLRKLLTSQIHTLLFVVGATLLAFAILLRSATLSLIGLLPNLLGVGVVIATMGYVGVPLDIMTITIASISVGMGVDDAIHYLHRFRQELASTDDVRKAIKRSHDSVGKAMYFTSAAVVVGFSVLTLSAFLPTVRFGLLTGLAMMVVLVANLLVVPAFVLLSSRWLGSTRLATAVGAERED